MSALESRGGRELATKTGGAGGAEFDSLPGVQRTAMESLLVGSSVVDAARASGVSRGTIYNWLKHDSVFRAAYNQWHEVMKESCRSRVLMMLDKAASAVEKALEAGDVRPAMQLLVRTGMVVAEKEKSTDAGELKRVAAVKKRKREDKLGTDEFLAGMG